MLQHHQFAFERPNDHAAPDEVGVVPTPRRTLHLHRSVNPISTRHTEGTSVDVVLAKQTHHDRVVRRPFAEIAAPADVAC